MLADRLLEHVLSFSLKGVQLPEGVGILDPFSGEHGSEVKRIVTEFHRKFYSDAQPRLLMLGINPGRLGAGSTGLSFTDTKRCVSDLRIAVSGMRTHEPSSDFFYRMIRAAGGAQEFYSRVYVHAICPLGFVKLGAKGSITNLNYYDDADLERAVTPFVEEWLRKVVNCGMRRDAVIIIGTGKNTAFFGRLNERLGMFREVRSLEHPRYVMQYKAKQLDAYIRRYLDALDDLSAR